MTTPGSRPRKGFLASFQAVMAPVPPEDDGSPIVRPTVINVASGLALLAAICFIFTGVVSFSTTETQADLYRTSWNQAVAECNTYLGGIGTAVPSTVATPTGATGIVPGTSLPDVCRSTLTTAQVPAATIDSYKSTLKTYGIIFVLVGLAAGAAGWYLRTGARWARRVLIGIGLLSLAAAALLGISTTLTLLATLLIVVGLVLTYIGRGGLFYGRIALRRNNTRH